MVVTELINRELLDEANRVCKRYNYSSNDLAKVREAIDAVMRDEANPLAQVGTLAAKSAGERIQTVWNIKQQLRVTYDEILSFSHEQTITILLSLVPVFRLSSHTVASVWGDAQVEQTAGTLSVLVNSPSNDVADNTAVQGSGIPVLVARLRCLLLGG